MKMTVAILKAIKVRVTKSNRELWSIEALIETVLKVLIVTVTLTVRRSLAVARRSERLLSYEH